MNYKNILLLTCSLSLMSCSWWAEPIDVKCTPTKRAPLSLTELQPIKPKHLEWFVITPENYKEIFKKLKERNYSLVLFGLTDDGYENLSMTNAEVRAYIVKQKSIIAAYKKYYEPEDNTSK